MLGFYLSLFATIVISYFLGSCNSAIIFVKLLKNEDIREKGSKNAGLTNTLRCYGKGLAGLTLVGDLLKGVVAVILSLLAFKIFMGADIFEAVPAELSWFLDFKTVGYVSGFFSILGHIFPIYYGFRGGKGVLVSCSILLVVDPLTFVIIIPFFVIMVVLTKYVSVSSISAAAVYPFLTFVLHFFVEGLPIENSLTHMILVLFTGILLIYMHRENIKRLKSHTENKISFGGKK